LRGGDEVKRGKGEEVKRRKGEEVKRRKERIFKIPSWEGLGVG